VHLSIRKIGFFLAFLFAQPCWSGVQDMRTRTSVALTAEADSFVLQLSPTINSQGIPVLYQPNTSTVSGVQVSYAGFSAAYRTSSLINPQLQNLYGNTSYEDIRGTFALGSKAQWLVMGYYNRYSSLYISNSNQVDPAYTPGVSYIIRPDVSIFNSGASLIYVWSPENFSVAATMLQSAKQSESAGSFLLQAGFDGTLFSASSPLVPGTQQNNYGSDSTLSKGEFTTLSAGLGYGYTLTKWDFYLSGFALLGGGYQWRTYQTASGESSGLVNASKFTVNFSLGYNSDSFFVGATYLTTSTEYPTSSVRLKTDLSAVKLFVGSRF
jgi:Domain of unknown function (DUF4421)